MLVALTCLAWATGLRGSCGRGGLRPAVRASDGPTDVAIADVFAAQRARAAANGLPPATVDAAEVTVADPVEQRRLFRRSLLVLLGDHAFITSVIAAAVWRWGSLDAAASYGLGAAFGAFYLYLLARYVESVGVATLDGARSSGVSQARFAVVGLLVLLAGKNPSVIEFIPLLGGFFSYQLASFVQAFRPASTADEF